MVLVQILPVPVSVNTSSSSISSSILDYPNDSICGGDALLSSTPLIEVSPDEINDEIIHTVLQEQQQSWEDATTDTQTDLTDTLDPPILLDHQMICDIQKIASRLAAKSTQLLGKS